MKRFILSTLALLLFFTLSAQYKIKTPALSQKATISELMEYNAQLEQKKLELKKIYMNRGKYAAKKFLREESPEIYNTIIKTEETGKKLAIIGGGCFVAGGAGLTTMVAIGGISNSPTKACIAGGCGIIAAVGAGLGIGGLLSIADACRDGVLLYERSVNDEVSRVKSYIPYSASLSVGETASGGYGLKLSF